MVGSRSDSAETVALADDRSRVADRIRRLASVQRLFEAVVCGLDVELQLTHLVLGDVLGSLHLVEDDEPLDDARSAVEIVRTDGIYGADDVAKQRV